MHYLLFYDKVPDYADRQAPLQSAHRDHVQAAVDRGEQLLGGMLADPTDGSAVILFQADSPATVDAFAAADPYVRHGVVNRWRVRQWETIVGTGAAVPLAGQ
jgi:uncharacterized protein YciI